MQTNCNTILIVDDAELNRTILATLFQNEYTILQAENGREALDLFSRNRGSICAILLDVVMPVMDGVHVLLEMNRRGWIGPFPIILITASTIQETLLLCYDLGVADIINKPFEPKIIYRRVRNEIELYAHRHRLEDMIYEQTAELTKANTQLLEQARKLKEKNNFIIDSLSTIVEFRNGESGAHIRKMRRITSILLHILCSRSPEYRMSTEEIETISSAAAMHDIGKICIPDSVLLKPGRLTPDEFEIMKTHTIRGCELLDTLNYDHTDKYYSYCYEICRHHHERWDGRGYPDKLAGDQIPICSQVVSLTDVYEALTSNRVYKAAYSHETAVQMIIHGECGAFNPALLRCFVDVSGLLHQDLLAEGDSL